MKKTMMTKGLLVIVALGAMVCAGCGEGNVGAKMLADALDSNIQRCATMYSRFHTNNDNQGPADKAAFVKFINEQDAERLKMLKIDPNNREAILISERDGEPFKIRYGVNTRVRGPQLPVIFESKGVDGKFLVAFAGGGQPKEVDKAEYDKMWAGEMDDAQAPERPGAR